MQPTTHFLRDILRQPKELRWTLDHLTTAAADSLTNAAAAIRAARHVYLSGIGSSWHAALNVAPIFNEAACPVYLVEASELLLSAEFPPDSAVIVISRSGRSVEVVQLAEKAKRAGAKVIGITNALDGTLAKVADFPIVVPIQLDHFISVNTYTSLVAAGGALALKVVRKFDGADAQELAAVLDEVERAIPIWQKQIAGSLWFAAGRPTYFLGRGGSLGAAHETLLMWEEGAKSPGTAMGTGVFRHGPQEAVKEGMRIGMWIDPAKMREQDLATARDLRKLGCSVMVIGQNLPADAGDLVLQLPTVANDWQCLIDCIPAQLAAEQQARVSGVDSDSFRLCAFVVEDEAGLLGSTAGPPSGVGAKS